MEVNDHLTEKGRRDLELVRLALQSGDQKAYAELLNLYRDSLYFMMLKMSRNPDDAEDLTIEAFGRAFRNLENYTPEFAFSTWLFRIAANNCIDFLRRNNRLKFAGDPAGEETDPDLTISAIAETSPGPEEKTIEKEKIKLMREVVHRLKPHYRTIVEMRYFRELSYEEIAAELHLPIGTVKAQLFRAREMLFEILKHVKERI